MCICFKIKEKEKNTFYMKLLFYNISPKWMENFLFTHLWLVYFILTMTVALGINFCCSTSIHIPLYYICSLLYYWDNTVAQIMYLYCSDTTCSYHFCTPWRCNANGERLMWLFWYKYHGYIRMIIFYVEVDDYFCTITGLSRQCRCWICKAFRIFRKMIHKPNMGIDFP